MIHAPQTQYVTPLQAFKLSVKPVNISIKRQLRAFVNHVRLNTTVKTVSIDKVLPAHNSPRPDILQKSIVHLVTSAPPQLRQLALQVNTLYDKRIHAQRKTGSRNRILQALLAPPKVRGQVQDSAVKCLTLTIVTLRLAPPLLALPLRLVGMEKHVHLVLLTSMATLVTQWSTFMT